MNTWIVSRIDDNGYETVMARHLSEQEANILVKIMTDKGHKQTYCASEEELHD